MGEMRLVFVGHARPAFEKVESRFRGCVLAGVTLGIGFADEEEFPAWVGMHAGVMLPRLCCGW